eukprot:COSAG01_NODE_3624_length_5858_cov_4.490710_5_plen_104_part_00
MLVTKLRGATERLWPQGAQMPLMRAVMKASKSVIIVIIGGRPATFGASALDGYNKMFTDASAVIAAWHPGEEGGHALWNILNGTVNPSGAYHARSLRPPNFSG